MSTGVKNPALEELRKKLFHWMDMCLEARRDASEWKESFKAINKMHNELRDENSERDWCESHPTGKHIAECRNCGKGIG